MPILVSPPEPLEDLSLGDLNQGDLLENVMLGYAGLGEKPWKTLQEKKALVVSRECQAQHGSHIVVAPVKATKSDFPKRAEKDTDEKYFAKIEKTLERLRDGTGSPDAFYLGTVSGDDSTRWYAQLDMLTIIGVPTSTSDRRDWLKEKRVATLSDSFRRSLPVRLFGCYARVGHHDQEWLCTQDLELFVHTAGAYEAEVRAEIGRKKAEYLRQNSAGNPGKQDWKKLEDSLRELSNRFKPFRDELDQRMS